MSNFHRMPLRLHRSLALTSVAMVLAYWTAVLVGSATAVWETAARRERPFALNGITIDNLQRYGQQVHGSGASPVSQRVRVILLSSDQCRYSHQDAPAWLNLIRMMGKQGVHVSVISTSGLDIPETLRQQATKIGISHDVWLIHDRAGFIGHTGLAGTPRTMLVDSAGKVRLSIPRLTEANLSLLASFAPAFRTRFGRNAGQ